MQAIHPSEQEAGPDRRRFGDLKTAILRKSVDLSSSTLAPGPAHLSRVCDVGIRNAASL
jgi:hypothetical protein